MERHGTVNSTLSPRDSALLSRLITSNFNLDLVAAESGIPLPDLIAWAASPAVARLIADLLRTARAILEIKAARARMAVLNTLQAIALTHECPTERRRAASALLRPFDRPPRPRPAQTPDKPPPIDPAVDPLPHSHASEPPASPACSTPISAAAGLADPDTISTLLVGPRPGPAECTLTFATHPAALAHARQSELPRHDSG